MLLTHRGGLEAFAPLYRTHRGRQQYLEQINARPLAHQPGSRMVYSDWDLILLQAIVFTIAFLVVVINVAIDVLYKFIDPRIKLA